MTLDLFARYPSQTISTDPDYPLGKARNVGTPGDGTGTPWEADLANDLHGTLQAILAEGGITASGDPDKVGASDVVAALKEIFYARALADALRKPALYTPSGTLSPNTAATLAEVFGTVGGYTLSSNMVQVPAAGYYLVAADLVMTTSNAANPAPLPMKVLKEDDVTVAVDATGRRFSGTSGDTVLCAATALVHITTPATEKLQIHFVAGGSSVTFVSGSRLSILGPF